MNDCADAVVVPTEAVAQKATLPFAILEQLDVACGYERSFKMLRNTLLANRYMLGVNTEDLTRQQLLEICRQIEMPNDHLDSIAAHLSDANLIFLGFEHSADSCIYKVYLEFWEKLKRDLLSRRNQQEPALLHLGYKWDTNDSLRRAITRYLLHPLLSVREILSRIAEIYATSDDRTSFAAAEEIIALAASRGGDVSLRYMEVEKGNSPRVSFDVNLYGAALRMSQIHNALARMRSYFSISSEEFRRLNGLVGNKLLGHISGGIDRNGESFFTVYYEV